MVKDQVIGSYIIRFTKSNRQNDSFLKVTLQDIKTGEQLEFETWLAAWAFLEDVLENQIDNDVSDSDLKAKFMTKLVANNASSLKAISKTISKRKLLKDSASKRKLALADVFEKVVPTV